MTFVEMLEEFRHKLEKAFAPLDVEENKKEPTWDMSDYDFTPGLYDLEEKEGEK